MPMHGPPLDASGIKKDIHRAKMPCDLQLKPFRGRHGPGALSSKARLPDNAGAEGQSRQAPRRRTSLRHSEARCDKTALRFPPGAERGAALVGRAKGTEPRSQ